MRSQRILIVYATHYGQTAKIARYMDRRLTASGFVVTLMSAECIGRDIRAQDFAAIIIGGSVMLGRHHRSLVRFVRTHREWLNTIPSAFFSVSGSAASAIPSSQATARRRMAELLKRTGWSPTISATFGGAVAYTQYNPLLRIVMRRIAAKEGLPTDSTRDYEGTDWAAVDSVIDHVAAVARWKRLGVVETNGPENINRRLQPI